MKERILEIIKTHDCYSEAIENIEVFNILINGMLESCETDDELIQAFINTVYSCSIIFENIMNIIAQTSDKETIDKVASMVSEVFVDEESTDP